MSSLYIWNRKWLRILERRHFHAISSFHNASAGIRTRLAIRPAASMLFFNLHLLKCYWRLLKFIFVPLSLSNVKCLKAKPTASNQNNFVLFREFRLTWSTDLHIHREQISLNKKIALC